ncbi:MAG: homoserine dehydrogenase [Massilistercora timonensis]
MVNIAVMGYGTVGSGVVEVINTNGKRINQRIGEELNIKYVLDLRDFPGDPVQEKIIHDFETIVNDDEIKIVVEVMGGIEPAYTFVKRCLLAGKSVATSNKALVAKHGAELLSIAREKNINFLFEASVGGGIPIIRPLNSSLTADEIEEITGILNGTTNYMMTKMFYEGADYDTVLKEAQANGFAEQNPEADVEGYDACRKIAILSSLISGQQVDFEDIYCEGITRITVEDMKYAKEMGMTIKLLASSKRQGEKLHAIVAPCLIYPEHPLYSVDGVFNAIFVHGNVLGDAMFYGSGAGKLPTASAVVADVVEEAKNLNRNVMTMWKQEKLEIEDKADASRRFFVRMKGEAKEMLPGLEKTFGKVEVVQVPGLDGEFGFTTCVMTEGAYEDRAKGYQDQILHMIRIEDLDEAGE